MALAGAPAPETALAPCAAPREVEAEAGHTRRVACEDPGAGLRDPDAALRGPARALFGLGIDPNRADASTLEALPGIGPVRAAAIVAGRAEGPYRTLADLGRVRGIGPVTLRRSAAWWSFAEGEAAPDTRR